ncbi:Uncharacterised protein [uncultured archaeon]|nr:Uncharacterised protein [uncultured archaeon]
MLKKGGERSNSLNKRGQVTLFVILGIIIVAAAILIYIFYPQIKNSLGVQTKAPSVYMQECLQKDLQDYVDKLSVQGGKLNPSVYILYKDQKIEYLCYTNEYYKPCVMQIPGIKGSIEGELSRGLKDKTDSCFKSMIDSYQGAGYDVRSDRGDTTIELLPNRVAVRFNSTIVLQRGETQRYSGFNVVVNNNIYELASIAESILNWEARYGNADTTPYMVYYNDLKVEKYQQSDGSRIYIITDRNTGNKFQFASRSYAFPAGY